MGIGDAITQATNDPGATREMDAVELEAAGLPANGGPPAAADSSILAAVRAQAQALAADTTVELAIPGYSGVLVGRYKAVSLPSFITVRGGEVHNPFTEWGAAADVLATALIGIYARNAAGELTPLFRDQEARFDDDLVQLLELTPTESSARGVIVALCGGGARGQTRAWALFGEYRLWLTEGTALEVAGDAVEGF
jgi:hypothetical protein